VTPNPEAPPPQCALPGCEKGTPQDRGGVWRKYCSDAHRAAARRRRRRRQPPASPPAAAGSAPSDPSPAGTPRPRRRREVTAQLVPQLETGPIRRLPGWARVALRSRRRVLLVAIAGAVAVGGTAAVVAIPLIGDGTTTSNSYNGLDGAIAGEPAWASAARVSLASVQQQLATIDQVEAAWNAQPARARSGPIPAPVATMLARQAALRSQQAMLGAQLAAVQNLANARTTLAQVQAQLAATNKVLSAQAPAPPLGAVPSPGSSVAAQLTAQRDLLAREAAELTSEAAGWREQVQAAAAAPAPSPVDTTTPITNHPAP